MTRRLTTLGLVAALAACTGIDYGKMAEDVRSCAEMHAPGVAFGAVGTGMTKPQRIGYENCMRERGYETGHVPK
jgi:hypothetical protein